MVILDCSGSMTLELEGAKAEVANIVDAYGAPVDFVTFDTKVNVFPRLKDVTAVKATKLKGGGGTDITPVMEYIRSLPRHKRPRVVVSITDGWVGDCGPAIPGVEYLWVLTAVGVVPAKYGKVFRLPPIKAPSY
jgi:predicted metal-dependent peptidase